LEAQWRMVSDGNGREESSSEQIERGVTFAVHKQYYGEFNACSFRAVRGQHDRGLIFCYLSTGKGALLRLHAVAQRETSGNDITQYTE
jgi:hypothetical protein